MLHTNPQIPLLPGQVTACICNEPSIPVGTWEVKTRDSLDTLKGGKDRHQMFSDLQIHALAHTSCPQSYTYMQKIN